MPPDTAAPATYARQLKRFASAEEALRRQDGFDTSPFTPDQPSLLVWQSPRGLLAAPSDSRLAGFGDAARACAAAGWPVAVRRAGGGLCPVSPGTLQFAISRPVAGGLTIEAAYAEMVALIERLLGRFGLSAQVGTCETAFCPGRYDIAVAGRKIAGMAQTWRSRAGVRTATTGASLILNEDPEVLADAVNLFYSTAQSPLRCDAGAIGSLSGTLARDVPVAEVLAALEPGPAPR